MTPKIVVALAGWALAAAAVPAIAQCAVPARVSAIAPWVTADLMATFAASLR